MASHLVPNPGPHISTPATNRLLTYLNVLARRRPDTVAAVIAVRRGNDEPLLGLVRAAQAGDADAGAIAVGALLPQLCKVVLNKERAGTWETSIDDYIALAYFTIAAVRPDETSTHLASKIISRTRQRHEWELETARRARPVTDGALLRGLPPVPDIVGEVLGRLDLDELARAIDRVCVTPEQWRAVTRAAFGKPGAPAQPTEQRQAACRARRRLASWLQDSEAA